MDFQSRNLVIPRGKVLFARYLPGTQVPGAFKEIGNTPEFTMNREVQKLAHFGSQGPWVKAQDEEIVTDSRLTGSLRTDDMRATNVALWFMGTPDTVTQTSVSSTTQTETVDKGDIIQLGRTVANPAGARNVTVASVAPSPTGTAYIDNVDYLIHPELGLVEILPTGAIPDRQEIVITYTASAATFTRIAMGDVDAEGELKFVSFNPQGENHDTTIPRVKISPNGDLSMLTDPENPAWQDINLSITALRKDSLALAYRNGRPVA